jgi:hypothetical protein
LPSLAIIVAYDDSSLWDFKHLILWWQHVGLMARGSIVLLVSVSRVIFVGWQWISLWAFAIWFVIGGYWDGVCPVVSFSSLDFRGSGMRFIVRAHYSCQPPEL